MFEKIKKKMPAGILTVGFIIFVILIILSRSLGRGYEAVVMGELMQESAMVVLAECLAGAVAFKILLRKEKS